ncbi:MAG: phosphomethylpyrimidine kinase, partial [Gammaproteobacteria bacterium]|nr:phosphomethylpyrimidine kinase [Gammaproteobacteria bacterium]
MSETAWTIAGSDSGGGAGVQADLLTFHDFGLHGASVVTCVTAQNTTALTDNHVIPAATVRAQLEALWDDLAPAAIKIGALGSPDNASAVLEFLSALPNDGRPFVVWDPVRYASVGGALGVLSDDTIDAFLRHVDVVTPNAEELADTWNIDPHSPAQAARLLRNRGAERVYLTGGHGNTPGVDHWESAECSFAIRGDALPGRGAHGGGCSLSSALAAATVREDEESAPVLAHMYVHQGLRAIASRVGNPGAGRPPLPHLGWPGDAE